MKDCILKCFIFKGRNIFNKNCLTSLDTPADVADALAEQASAIRKKIETLSESLKEIETLQAEVLQMKSAANNFIEPALEAYFTKLGIDPLKAKLLFLKMSMDGCNVLILDEPTRNFSPLSNPIIRRILSDYTGAIISVSHDRKYIEEVCEKIYRLDKDGLGCVE